MVGLTIEQIRNRLRTWRERLARAQHPHFYTLLTQVWNNLGRIPETSVLIEKLSQHPSNDMVDILFGSSSTGAKFKFPDSEETHIELCVDLVCRCLNHQLSNREKPKNVIEAVGNLNQHSEWSVTPIVKPVDGLVEHIKVFCYYFLDPIFDYLDQNLESRSVMLVLMKRYKDKVELFRRRELNDLCLVPNRPEAEATRHFFEYLHDNRIVYYVEPVKGEGEIDLIAGQGTKEPLLAEAKVFKGRRAGVLSGFHQIHRYTTQYNESTGYLIVFNCSTRPLIIEEDGTDIGVPLIRHGGKVIYFLVVNTCPKPTPASKLEGKYHQITRDEIIKYVESDVPKDFQDPAEDSD